MMSHFIPTFIKQLVEEGIIASDGARTKLFENIPSLFLECNNNCDELFCRFDFSEFGNDAVKVRCIFRNIVNPVVTSSKYGKLAKKVVNRMTESDVTKTPFEIEVPEINLEIDAFTLLMGQPLSQVFVVLRAFETEFRSAFAKRFTDDDDVCLVYDSDGVVHALIQK